MLTQHAIKMVQRNLTPGGDKNGADINLALDALEMAFTHPHINAFVIVGGDSDFISLVEKLKQYDKKIFVVGGRQFTSGILQRNCHEFIAYENLVGAPASAQPANGGGSRQAWRPQRARGAHADRAGDSARQSRAGRADRARSVAAARPAQEHAAAARLDVFRTQLRRGIVPRLRREAGGGRRASRVPGQGRMAGRAGRWRRAGRGRADENRRDGAAAAKPGRAGSALAPVQSGLGAGRRALGSQADGLHRVLQAARHGGRFAAGRCISAT